MKLFNRKERRAGAKEPRTTQEIQVEYGTLCAMIGEKDFNISMLEAQKKELYQKIHSLGTEMQNAQVKESKQKAPEQTPVAGADNAAV